METHNESINEAPLQQVYVIQLDHNVQFESQAIPLHILENDLNPEFIMPFLQQKQGQPLELFLEPQGGVSENITSQNKLVPCIELNPTVINTVGLENPNPVIKTCDYNISKDQSQNPIMKLDNSTPFIPTSVKKEPVVDITIKSVQSLNDSVKSEPCLNGRIKNYVHISDTKVPPRAVAVLPSALHFRGKLILPRRTLSAHVRFGPVQGIRKIIAKTDAERLLELADTVTPVFLLKHDEQNVIHIEVTDKDKSNWLGLLPLGQVSSMSSPTTANVWIYEEDNELYALTAQPIPSRVPLKIGYSKKYCEDHNIKNRPMLDLETANSIEWWCNECNRALPSASLLRRHTDVYHKVTMNASQSYRCKYCKRPFARLFSLKRHMHTHCTKRPKKSTDDKDNQQTEMTQENTEADINAVLEDNRIPSDESFQNFTNSLDFSTNLFDTDRMAGLDLSGNSRAESEINPYSMGFRDDNDLGFANGNEPMQSNETKQENTTPMLETCSYCNQVVAKESKNKHLRQCPSRLICECGRVFRHKKSLAIHIHKAHPDLSQEKDVIPDEEEKEEMAYKCQECPLGFKRRGMLVNHLWRIHKLISTTPVERKVKRYPCVACPRIYCSASKRDLHVRAHHPGAEKQRGRYIEGGVKSCQPASCTECPRQYATRAKLLQHIRARHPLLAKTIYSQQMEQKTKTKLKTSNKKHEEIDKNNSKPVQIDLTGENSAVGL